jgi:hypothetical protein
MKTNVLYPFGKASSPTRRQGEGQERRVPVG